MKDTDRKKIQTEQPSSVNVLMFPVMNVVLPQLLGNTVSYCILQLICFFPGGASGVQPCLALLPPPPSSE